MTDAAASAPIAPSQKRQPDPATGEEDQEAKKSKPTITEEMRRYALDNLPESIRNKVSDDVLKRLHLITREDLKLSHDDRLTKTWERHFQELAEQGDDLPEEDEPGYGPDDPLPKGHEWTSYVPESGNKDFIIKMNCYICGVGLDHWPEHCPKRKPRQGATGE